MPDCRTQGSHHMMQTLWTKQGPKQKSVNCNGFGNALAAIDCPVWERKFLAAGQRLSLIDFIEVNFLD